MDLDALLDGAAPPLAERSHELTGLLDELVVATRPARPRGVRRRVTRWGAAAGVVGVLGIGGAAAAGVGPDLVQGLFPWTADGGGSCVLEASFEPREPGDPNYSTSQTAAVAAVAAWADSFDLDAVDRQASRRR